MSGFKSFVRFSTMGKVAVLAGGLLLSASMAMPLMAATQEAEIGISAADAPTSRPPERISRPMVAVDPVTLQGEGLSIRLWGIKPAEAHETPLEVKALDLMDELIGNDHVNCKVMGGSLPEVSARCVVTGNKDLGIELLSRGFVIVDRRQTYNTVFASAYAQAQEEARLSGRGVWKLVSEPDKDSALPKWLAPYLDVLIPVALILGPFGGLLIVALMMRKGLNKIAREQQKEVEDTHRREVALQTRERQVLASTLEGEFAENKNRIEAFLVIYGDMLRNLTNADEVPKYQQGGDIIQKYPAFSRTVFEASVNKISLLDMKAAGMVSRFYASLPREQEYINLDPDVPLETAVKLVEKVMKGAEEFLTPINQSLQLLQAVMAAPKKKAE